MPDQKQLFAALALLIAAGVGGVFLVVCSGDDPSAPVVVGATP